MLHRRLKTESGYTLVEVMVSIIILAIAILPMAGMFDMALNSATESGHYDKARTLANLKLEEAKSLSFADVENNFPEDATSYNDSGYYDSTFIPETGPAGADFTDYFQYRVEKQYMAQPPKDPADPTENFAPCDPTSAEPTIACSPGTSLIRVTVTVQWGDNTYTTFGLVAE